MTAEIRCSHKSDELKTCFERCGFVVVQDLLSKQDVLDVRNQFLDFLKRQAGFYGVSPADNETAFVQQMFSKTPTLRKHLYEFSQRLSALCCLGTNVRILEACEKLGLQIPISRNVAIRIDLPEEGQYLQPLHQDVRGIKSANAVNFWVPLQDVDERSGGLTVLLGSHVNGPIMPVGVNESGYQIFSEEQIAPYEKHVLSMSTGEALIFSPYLVHGSTAVETGDLRLTVTIRYDDGAAMDWLEQEEYELAKYDVQ